MNKTTEISQPKQCVIKDENGFYYHPTTAPEGLSKCGVMLQLMAKKEPFIFTSKSRADHAIHHTIAFLKSKNIEVIIKFIIEVVG